MKMHPDEIEVSDATVSRLLSKQFPEWRDFPVRRVESIGTVNALFRVGDSLVARLPRIPRFQDEGTECWLRSLAGRLPLEIPEQVALGTADESYPWKWSVQKWIDGDPWGEATVAEPLGAAEDLAEFVHSLQAIDPSQLSCPSPKTVAPLSASDAMVRRFAPRATGIDLSDFLAVWEQAINLPQWTGKPVLLHGDLRPDNLLVRDGRLAAVIDWAGVAVGDPAIDLAAAWWVFTGEGRRRFRAALPFDEATWLRAQAAPLGAVVGIVYYAETNPPFAAALRRTLIDVLAEWPGPRT